MSEIAYPDDARLDWFDDVAAALGEKSPATVAHELPGLVDHLTEEAPDVVHYVVGVSFTKKHSCLDYAIDRVLQPDAEGATQGPDDDPVVESVKAPASESHRYVHFVHPPDPHFDAAALRARLLGAIHRERRAATDQEPASTFADLWAQL